MNVVFRFTLRLFGLGMVLTGLLWILKALRILGGSAMTGQLRWAAYGLLLAAAGAVLLTLSRRFRGRA